MEADAAHWGLVLDPPEEPVTVEVWEDHRGALQAWLAVAGQWRTAPVGLQGATTIVWLGLDYAAARAGLDMAGITVSAELWRQVQMIEAGAREELNRGR